MKHDMAENPLHAATSRGIGKRIMHRNPRHTKSVIRLVKRLAQILDEIVNILDAHRQPDELVGDADLEPLLPRQFEMRHTTGKLREAFDGAQTDGQSEDVEVVKDDGGIHARNDLEAQDPAETAQTLRRQRGVG